MSEEHVNTKEIENLNDLRELAIDTLELEILDEMDENAKESTENFEKAMEVLEEPKEEKEEKKEPKKQTKFAELKKKWNELPKKKKGIIITIFIIVLLLLIGTIIFFLTKKEEPKEEEKDIIVNLDNYRYQNGKLIFLDKNKNELGEYPCKNEDQELCYVAYYSDEDHFDQPKYKYENDEEIKRRSNIIMNRYVFVYDNKEAENGLITLYDIQEQKEIDTYQLVKGYENLPNQVILKNKASEYALIRFTEEEMELKIPYSYEYLGIIENKEDVNRVVAKQNGKWYLTDLENSIQTKPISNEIKNYSEKGIKTIDSNGNYHAVNYNNQEIKEADYEFIDLLDQYIILIQNKNAIITDYEGNNMNLDPIALNNDFYIPIHTYSKENKLIKTEKSYEITYQGAIMNMEIWAQNGIDSEKKSINLNEGKLSAKLSFLNYFDGKLYIYKEKEKQNLIGTYSCEVKNQVGDDTTSLSNCKMASESYYQDNDINVKQDGEMGLLPIFNERYAFIQDNNVIVLYDLKENTTKAKYKSVDAESYTKSNDLSFVTANNKHIIAENTNGKYGIIKIDYNSIEGVKGFDFNHIERMDFYYITQNESGYSIMDHEGNMISSSVTNKIRNINSKAKYMTVKESSKYYLYSIEGKKVLDKGFDYITPDIEYFGAVENGMLNFYSYKEPTIALSDGLKLNRNNYYGEGILAYTFEINGTKAEIKIGTANNSYQTKSITLEKTEPVQNKEDDTTPDKEEVE